MSGMEPSHNGSAAPYPVEKIFTTVWRKGVTGKLQTQWYEGIECRQSDLMKSVVHWAFLSDRHMEATTCDEALSNLDKVLGPVHKTDWGCVYSESEKGWFRPECKVTPPPPRSAREAVESLWGTTGGAFLIIFIVFLCIFFIWWVVGCYRIGEVAWPWTVCRGFQKGRNSYKRQREETEMNLPDIGTNYSIDNEDNNSSDNEDIYLQS